jgi:hypothetical protein
MVESSSAAAIEISAQCSIAKFKKFGTFSAGQVLDTESD